MKYLLVTLLTLMCINTVNGDGHTWYCVKLIDGTPISCHLEQTADEVLAANPGSSKYRFSVTTDIIMSPIPIMKAGEEKVIVKKQNKEFTYVYADPEMIDKVVNDAKAESNTIVLQPERTK